MIHLPNQEILRPEEIEELLLRIKGEYVSPDEDRVQESTVRSLNLAAYEKIVRGRMPSLEVINDRFARGLRMSLFNFMRKSVEVSTGQVQMIKYSEFMRNLKVPTTLNVFSMQGLSGQGVFILEPVFIYSMIDYLFGGGGRVNPYSDGRGYTETEQKIVNRLLSVIFKELNTAWEPAPIQPDFQFIRSEIHSQFANIATPSEMVVACMFNVEIGSITSTLHVCIPYNCLTPLRDFLQSHVQSDNTNKENLWAHSLSSQIESIDVQVRVEFGHAEVTVDELSTLSTGDVILLDKQSTITVEVNEVPLFEGLHGQKKGHYAVRIEKVLNPDAMGCEQSILRLLQPQVKLAAQTGVHHDINALVGETLSDSTAPLQSSPQGASID